MSEPKAKDDDEQTATRKSSTASDSSDSSYKTANDSEPAKSADVGAAHSKEESKSKTTTSTATQKPSTGPKSVPKIHIHHNNNTHHNDNNNFETRLKKEPFIPDILSDKLKSDSKEPVLVTYTTFSSGDLSPTVNKVVEYRTRL